MLGHRSLETSRGYHCIELMYPDDIAAAEVCRDDRDPKSYEAFRWAIIKGGASPHLTIDRVDSIEHRLHRLLLLLSQLRPREDWGQFLHGSEIAWERIAVAGQSQGGGHAGLIGVKYHVARVIMFGAPKDYSRARRQPATWYSEPKATPVEAFFSINHRQDRVGCSFDEVLQSLHVLPRSGRPSLPWSRRKSTCFALMRFSARCRIPRSSPFLMPKMSASRTLLAMVTPS